MSAGRPPATQRPATAAETGRVCPYCRFPLKQGAEIMECGGCHAPHHADCWSDNAGCAVMGCTGAPGAAADATVPLPPPRPPGRPPGGSHPPPPNTYPPPRPSVPSGGSGLRRTAPPVAIAVIVLALAIAGGAVALVVSNKEKSANAVPPTVTVSPPPPAAAPIGDGDAPPPPPPTAGVLPDVDEATMTADITQVLRSHHQAIVAGSYSTAWVLTSERYRRKKERELGSYDKWAEGQVDLGSHLDPSGLSVSIRELDRRSGVATVDVTGMGWSKPGSNCSTWAGVTWALYENGHWRYEPGYSMSDQRRAKWQSRAQETLGWGC